MNEKTINVLYIDDEENNLSGFKASFRRCYHVFTASSACEGMEILKNNKLHVIISDQRMPGMTGIEFFESIIETYPDPVRMLLTGYADLEAVVSAINKGQIYKYFSKPWSEEEIKVSINKAYEIYTLREENRQLTAKLLDVNEQLEFLLRQKLLS